MVIADLGEYVDTSEPCRLCRKESISISGHKKYCIICYKELLANAILK